MICRKRGKTKRIRAAVALALALSLSAGLLGGCGDDNNNGGSKSVSEAQIGALSYHADGKHFVCLRRSFYSENGRDYYAAEQLTDNSRNIFDLTPGYSCMDGLDSYQNSRSLFCLLSPERRTLSFHRCGTRNSDLVRSTEFP